MVNDGWCVHAGPSPPRPRAHACRPRRARPALSAPLAIVRRIDRAVDRYAQFLQLAKEHPGTTLVPTLDVDLIWHVHMLSPRDYRDDCEQMLGRLLTHDDQKSDEELAGAFKETSGKWAETHATPYVWRANHVDHRHYAFCGSCGWGEELFHSNLGHLEVEATQVEAVYGSSDAAADYAEPEPWAMISTPSSEKRMFGASGVKSS